MEAGKRTITDIFNQGRVLEIPYFQRSYVWTDENWERFLNDVEVVSAQNNPYFLGSVILKARPVSSGNAIGDWRMVVDGQQRLTTITLLFKALCEVQAKGDDFFERLFYNRRKEIILKHNHLDHEIFEAIIDGKLTKALAEKYKHSGVFGCYNYFKKRADVLATLNLDTLLDRLYFLGIDLGPDEDEQQIFDTINSLGVSLTTAELLKNELFRREDETLYARTWKESFEKDEDTKSYWELPVTAGRQYRVNIDLLLQSYLLIQSEAQDKYLGLSSLFANYKTFIKDKGIQRQNFVETLVDYARHYRENINPELMNEEVDQESSIERLNIALFGLNTTTVVPYILYVVKEVEDPDERSKMFRLLESYLIRRVVCRETTKNYNNLFASFIRNKVNSYGELRKRVEKSEDPTNRFPNDAALSKGFLESKLSNQQARIVLYLIEKSNQNPKDATIIRPFNEYTVEHIMPKKWRNNWKFDGNADDRDDQLRKLGNLTLLTAALNTSIRDASWATKKIGRAGKKGLEEYSAGIRTFGPYLKLPDWNEALIAERGRTLGQHAVKIWALED